MGVNGVLCPGAGATSVSLGLVCDLHKANCLVTSSEATVFATSPSCDVLVNDLKDLITRTKSCLFVAPRNNDSMYEIKHIPFPHCVTRI